MKKILRVTVLSRVRDPCHFTRNYGNSAHTDCNTKLKLNHKILILLHNLKNYDAPLILKKLGKIDFKLSAAPNGLEKCSNFNINNTLALIDNFQFLVLH